MLTKRIFELIRAAATNVPADVVAALASAKEREKRASRGKLALEVILQNIALAKSLGRPICQDTGALTFFVKADPRGWKKIEKLILTATAKATKIGLLRPNAVDSVSSKNLGNVPKIEFEVAESLKISPNPSLSSLRRVYGGLSQKRGAIEIQLLLKGGGSENVSNQISLPAETRFGLAGRDLTGVKRAALEMIQNSVGKGCPPGIASIVIGGDRAAAFTLAKKNLLKKIGAKSRDKRLQKLADEILHTANATKIGPGGLGGRTTLLDCRVDSLPRHPASFFVTLAYSCWATRRAKIDLSSSGKVLAQSWSVKSDEIASPRRSNDNVFKKINLPVSEKEVRKLRAGEVVSVSGRVFTARDRVHDLATKRKLPKSLKQLGVFHCGPIAVQKNGKWVMVAAGPTTSARLDAFTPKFIEKTGVRVLIGKGGMGEATAKACKIFGAVYLHAIGGAASFYANSIKKVHGVDFLDEFGMPEALWELEIDNFLAVVGMDARGRKCR